MRKQKEAQQAEMQNLFGEQMSEDEGEAGSGGGKQEQTKEAVEQTSHFIGMTESRIKFTASTKKAVPTS